MLIVNVTREFNMRTAFLYSNTSSSSNTSATSSTLALRIAQTWLGVGSLALLCLPVLRGRSEWLGWLPLWCAIIPAAHILLLRWRGMLTLSATALRRWHNSRRPRSRPRSGRRLRNRSMRQTNVRGRPLLAALLLR
ncbi:MAG: hypothetical protein JSR65_09635 [Proteobacteria bacterium]|nr:hypothetical protein [Pseudomonadota bacterium]